MSKREPIFKIHKNALIAASVAMLLFLIPPLLAALFIMHFYVRIYPGAYVNKISVSGLSIQEANVQVMSAHKVPEKINIKVIAQKVTTDVVLDTSILNVAPDYNKAVTTAYSLGRSGNILSDAKLIAQNLLKPKNITLETHFNKLALNDFLSTVEDEHLEKAIFPKFILKNGQVTITEAVSGETIDHALAIKLISESLLGEPKQITLNTTFVDTNLTNSEQELAIARATSLTKKQIVLNLNGNKVKTLKIDKILSLLNPKGNYIAPEIQSLSDSLKTELDQETSEPVFRFESGKVEEFSPGEPGITINAEDLAQVITTALSTLEQSEETSLVLEIPNQKAEPKTKISDVNNLGIKELLGRGTSRFSGSIPSRIHNVALAASRINGSLVPPGETFSFAKAIGDISKYTGYKEAYIIQSGRTVLGDGGGVCQVSTTLFRAVMSAGLPITERHAHAYRVGYYEQDSGPGLDATVFVPSVDFKFKNDTGNYILVQTKVDTAARTAEFSIYGTSDGRVSTVTKPVVTNQIAPPPDEYIDDPTLPAGKINQVEHSAWGARVSFSYSVKRGEETLFEKNFVSTYTPWKNVFMRGTGPT